MSEQVIEKEITTRRRPAGDNAPSGDSNHNRNDEIDDVILNTRWKLMDFFGLRLDGTYRHGNSDRKDRNYDAFSVTGGFFVEFGNED